MISRKLIVGLVGIMCFKTACAAADTSEYIYVLKFIHVSSPLYFSPDTSVNFDLIEVRSEHTNTTEHLSFWEKDTAYYPSKHIPEYWDTAANMRRINSIQIHEDSVLVPYGEELYLLITEDLKMYRNDSNWVPLTSDTVARFENNEVVFVSTVLEVNSIHPYRLKLWFSNKWGVVREKSFSHDHTDEVYLESLLMYQKISGRYKLVAIVPFKYEVGQN